MSGKINTALVVVGVLIGLPILMCGGCLTLGFIGMAVTPPHAKQISTPAKPAATTSAASPKLTTWPGEIITAEEFARIQTGMTYGQVVDIVGSLGEMVSKSEIGDITTTISMWKNANGSNANVTSQNGKVVAKAQFGLPSRPGSEATEEGEIGP